MNIHGDKKNQNQFKVFGAEISNAPEGILSKAKASECDSQAHHKLSVADTFNCGWAQGITETSGQHFRYTTFEFTAGKVAKTKIICWFLAGTAK